MIGPIARSDLIKSRAIGCKFAWPVARPVFFFRTKNLQISPAILRRSDVRCGVLPMKKNTNVYTVRRPNALSVVVSISFARYNSDHIHEFFMNIHDALNGVIPCKILRLLSRNQPIG